MDKKSKINFILKFSFAISLNDLLNGLCSPTIGSIIGKYCRLPRNTILAKNLTRIELAQNQFSSRFSLF